MNPNDPAQSHNLIPHLSSHFGEQGSNLSDSRLKVQQRLGLQRFRFQTFDLQLEVADLRAGVAQLGVEALVLFFQGLQIY